MKTKILILAVFLFGFAFLNAQELNNTKWKGDAKIPNPTTILVEFRNYTVNVSFEGEVIEYMWFDQKGDKVVLGKYWGGSPCNPTGDVGGEFKLVLKGETMKLEPVKDACTDRANSLKDVVFTKVK